MKYKDSIFYKNEQRVFGHFIWEYCLRARKVVVLSYTLTYRCNPYLKQDKTLANESDVLNDFKTIL